MKKIFTLLSFCFFAATHAQVTYMGNGNSGFGGPIGQGSITIADNLDSLAFVLTKGGGSYNDLVVVYIDTKAGGFANTTSFTDYSSDRTTAISGKTGVAGQVSDMFFPADFMPDYAIALKFDNPPSMAGGGSLFKLQAGTLQFVKDVQLTPSLPLTPNCIFGALKTDLEFTSTMKFIVTFVSTTAWRSNEAIGFNFAAAAPNPGQTNVNVDTFKIYTSVLPVSLSNFNGKINNNSIVLNWVVNQEENVANYVVEKLIDGNFVSIATVKPNANNYMFTDVNVTKNNVYRIKIIGKNGSSKLSSQIAINTANKQSVLVYPTLVNNGLVNIKTSQDFSSKTSIKVMNTMGQIVHQKNMTIAAGEMVMQYQIQNLLKGIYFVEINNGVSKNTFSIIAQ
jgi:Secretion system C-terminal sorting domain